MEQWVVAAKKADFNEMGQKYHIDPVVARILRNRDLINDNEILRFLKGTVGDMHHPFLMKDMKKGVELLRIKIQSNRRIRIIGDYDIDGVCSTFILVKGIQLVGGQVDTVIPHRMKDGYGLNKELIEEAYRDGIDTIVTCDNGISAREQIAYGKSLGMTIIVTDHHEVPYEENENKERIYLLPPADAIIDPKQEDCKYPFSGICGGLVAYKFIQALFIYMDYVNEEVMDEFLEIAAFATIGDVMELVDENRIVVKYGLKMMQQTKNIGLRALISITGLDGKVLTPYHIGFVLGPCMNATGRLDSAERSLHLLRASSWEDAVLLAGDLKGMNDSRKDLTAKSLEQAIQIVEEGEFSSHKVLVVFLPDCHESLAGIIAGRLRERYGKPSFVLTRAEECVKGSGRSVEGFHMYDEMVRCKEIFLKFGGHKLAAGLSIEEENILEFQKRMNEQCNMTEEDFIKKIVIDVPMPPSYVTKKLITDLRILEPFGNGNLKPVFAHKEVEFISGKVLGKNSNVGKFVICDEQKNRYEAVYFGDLEKFNGYIVEKYGEKKKLMLYQGNASGILLSIIYFPELNEYAGRSQIQMTIQGYQ